MPIETVPNTGLKYYLVAFDGGGDERTEPSGGKLSEAVMAAVRDEPVTDVFVMSHGWQGDVPAAREQYARWITAMAACAADIDRLGQARPGFSPLLVGLHWPSLPWGDEGLRSAASFAPGVGPAVERLVDEYAARIANTPPAREALRTIFEAAGWGAPAPALPPEVRAAYEVLDRESGLGSLGVGGPPGADRDPFDPQAVFAAVRSAPASFALINRDDLLAPLRTLSFWKMKDRARQFGEGGGSRFLNALLRAAGDRDVRLHLMGHSFGCIVVSASLAGPDGANLVRPVHSLALVQGALSLWSYCSAIPAAPRRKGYFRAVTDGRVQGPVVTTRSSHDTAVGRWYPLAARAAGQVVFAAPGQLPKYGGVGSFGAQGPGLKLVDQLMLAADEPYGFEAGTVYNLEGSGVIRAGGGFSGAHSDIARPEVAHAVWQAAGS
jgi:hypothetical protein